MLYYRFNQTFILLFFSKPEFDCSQLFGVCNDLDMAMRKCTKQERLAKTKVNLEEAKINQARTREKIAKMQVEISVQSS